MLEVSNIQTYGWQAAIRGMRNPMNSWAKSDSDWEVYDTNPNSTEFTTLKAGYALGPNDLDLATRLIKAGPEHAKFLRMIHVQMDINGPLYWVAEHDTYKVGTTRNSCSFMHKGVSKPFEISDFSVSDNRIYYLLSPIEKEQHTLVYPYETEEYVLYICPNDRQYKVYKNGKVFACPFSYVDTWGTGRTRNFPEKELKPSLNKYGYYELNLGGRDREKWLLHRLVAFCWIDNPENLDTVNHINGKKWENNVENLEWTSRKDNIVLGFKNGLYDNNKLHLAYNSWKNGHTILSPLEKKNIVSLYNSDKISRQEIQEKYNLSLYQLNNLLQKRNNPNQELFEQAYLWEKIIDELNTLRMEYLETKDETIFQAIRQLLPQGYNIRYTWDASLQTVLSICTQRKGHRLPEWETFRQACFENIPYFTEFYNAMTGGNN